MNEFAIHPKNREQSLMLHMLGIDEARLIYLNGKWTALYYRNYFSGQNNTLDKLEKEGLVSSERKEDHVTYYVTAKGITYLADALGIAIYDKNKSLPRKVLSENDISFIQDFWSYIKEADICVVSTDSGWSMKIILDPQQIDDFCDQFGIQDDTVLDCSLENGLIVIDLADLSQYFMDEYNPFQVEDMRPEGTAQYI